MSSARLSKLGPALAGLHLMAVFVAATALILSWTTGVSMLSAAALGLLGAPWTQLLLAAADFLYPNWLSYSGLPLAVILAAGVLLNSALLYLSGALAGWALQRAASRSGGV